MSRGSALSAGLPDGGEHLPPDVLILHESVPFSLWYLPYYSTKNGLSHLTQTVCACIWESGAPAGLELPDSMQHCP